MKKFFKEFKEFITRGNVLDMAVGIIIGSAFTAIITALVENILTPLLAMIPGTGDTGALQVVLRAVTDSTGALDLENSIILDFGAVISAVITFILTAFVLFVIIKTINSIHNKGKKLAEKHKKEIAAKLAKGEISEAQAQEETVEVTPVETTDDILREIRDLLKAAKNNNEDN